VRFEIRHRMHFDYGSPVSESQNEIRVRPLDGAHQRVETYRLTSDPAARVLSIMDYWGTNVDHLGIRSLHEEMEIVAEASVVTTAPEPVSADPPAAALDDPAFRTSHWEFEHPSPHVQWNEELAAQARSMSGSEPSVRGKILALVEHTRSLLRYEQGTTEIGVSLVELVAGGRGVCQDYAHLSIGLLRSVGIPARYVSGYLFAADETNLDDAESTVNVQTHAWIEAALPGYGWWGVDPTNGGLTGERHVVIGRGRDYADVPPVRSVFTGSAEARVNAEVVIAKLAPMGPTPSVTAGGRAVAPPFPASRWERQQHQQQQQQQQ
jgi:transglutaminase-like putative cysteine protease